MSLSYLSYSCIFPSDSDFMFRLWHDELVLVSLLVHSLPSIASLCRVSEDDGERPVKRPALHSVVTRPQSEYEAHCLMEICSERTQNAVEESFCQYEYVCSFWGVQMDISEAPSAPPLPSPSHMKPWGLLRISINIRSNLLRRSYFLPASSLHGPPLSCQFGSCCFFRNATPPCLSPLPPPPRSKLNLSSTLSCAF